MIINQLIYFLYIHAYINNLSYFISINEPTNYFELQYVNTLIYLFIYCFYLYREPHPDLQPEGADVRRNPGQFTRKAARLDAAPQQLQMQRMRPAVWKAEKSGEDIPISNNNTALQEPGFQEQKASWPQRPADDPADDNAGKPVPAQQQTALLQLV